MAMAVAAMAQRPEPNAFLNKRADSMAQIVYAIRTDPEVADRFSRHFGKSKEEVIAYFNTLHLAKLNEAGTYMIYAVDETSGVIKARPERLKAGTLVYADSSGMPILKARCGNALVPGSNQLTTTIEPTVGNTVETMRTVPVSEAAAVESVAQTTALAPSEPIALAPMIPETVTTGSSNQGFAVPAALAAIGGAGAFLIGGSGSNPVPEPASVVVIAGALAAWKLRRKNSK